MEGAADTTTRSASGAPASPTRVAGVDGCRGRWAVVTAQFGLTGFEVELVDSLAVLVDDVRAGRVAAAAIDMPIGLFDTGPRSCDVAARALLGPRRSTVFPAPARATLDATDYRDACDRSRAAIGKALSKQAFHLLPPIRQLDRLLGPDDHRCIVEAHPELAFARLAGEALPSKHRAEGRAAREAALAEALGPSFDSLRAAGATARVPIVDLFDAAALTITAHHVVAGNDRRLGHDGPDPTGKVAQVVY